jgi:uncharacterized protein YeaO (DUF488 family)
MITLRRVYDQEEPGENYKVLVDRFWPRGISKEKAGWHEWIRDLAPSNELRKWYNHDPGKWEQFKSMYREELSDKQDLLKRLRQLEKEHGTLALLYSSKEEVLNNAAALKEILQEGVRHEA